MGTLKKKKNAEITPKRLQWPANFRRFLGDKSGTGVNSVELTPEKRRKAPNAGDSRHFNAGFYRRQRWECSNVKRTTEGILDCSSYSFTGEYISRLWYIFVSVEIRVLSLASQFSDFSEFEWNHTFRTLFFVWFYAK